MSLHDLQAPMTELHKLRQQLGDQTEAYQNARTLQEKARAYQQIKRTTDAILDAREQARAQAILDKTKGELSL